MVPNIKLKRVWLINLKEAGTEGPRTSYPPGIRHPLANWLVELLTQRVCMSVVFLCVTLELDRLFCSRFIICMIEKKSFL